MNISEVKTKYQFLWIGCLESDSELAAKIVKGYNLASAQVSQQNILSGIEQVSGCCFDTINGSVLPPFPLYKDRDIQQIIWSHHAGCFDISVAYRNDRYINRLNCRLAMEKAVDRWVDERHDPCRELIVFVYSMRSSPMAAACRLKSRIPNAKLYLIVTDLPQYMDPDQSKVKAMLKKLDFISIKHMQKRFDGFILYAKRMAEFLKIRSDRWLLMEGSYDVTEMADIPVSKRSRAIMYSGKLEQKYGVDMLVDAFRKIKDRDVELWITGGGSSEQMIRDASELDSRIKFFGFLPSRTDVLALQQRAAVLVNMRLPSQRSSAYCFPSKLLEYMVSGVPVVTFRLDGIPDEYYKYLCVIEKETRDCLTQTLERFIHMNQTELSEIGTKAREFVIERKNNVVQAKRILNFIGIQF